MIDLILPSETNRSDVLDFYNEFEKSGETCIGFANHDNYDLWLQGMKNRKDAKDLPEGYVRENFYLCYDGGEMVGVFSLKFELAEFLLSFGGHVGYAVEPSRRCKGLATEIPRVGLVPAKNLGFDRILAICDEDNYASEKVILRNGGVFENKLFDPDENVFVKRFWIAL